MIDLVGINETSSTFTENFANGVLTVSDGTNTAQLAFSNFTDQFKFASDLNDGTLIYDPPPTSSTVAATPVAYAGHGQNFVFHAVSGFGANGSIDFAPSTSEANHIVNVHDEGDWTQPVIAADILSIAGIGHHDEMTPQQIQAMLSSTVHLH